jgi:hypothetical protein
MFSSEVRAQIQANIERAFETEGWTQADKDAAEVLLFTKAYTHQNGQARYWGFNGGGAASNSQKNYVRSLLRKHAGKKEAEILRNELNRLRMSGDRIDRQLISDCIEVLKGL